MIINRYFSSEICITAHDQVTRDSDRQGVVLHYHRILRSRNDLYSEVTNIMTSSHEVVIAKVCRRAAFTFEILEEGAKVSRLSLRAFSRFSLLHSFILTREPPLPAQNASTWWPVRVDESKQRRRVIYNRWF